MRIKRDPQGRLSFRTSNLKITNQYYEQYEMIDKILKDHPEILNRVHQEIAKAVDTENRSSRRQGRPCSYTSENVLRISIVHALEGEDLRTTIRRIDDGIYLREFTKIHYGPMMDFTVFCRLNNKITPETWKEVNQILAKSAVKKKVIDGTKLRVDTTAVETNIHYPSDSAHLWDVYRVLSRLIREARKLGRKIGRDGNLQESRVKRFHTRIMRDAGKKDGEPGMKRAYMAMLGLVERILSFSNSVVNELEQNLNANKFGPMEAAMAEGLIESINEYKALGDKVVDQAKRRVIDGEQVPPDEKLYSIFEPHTDILVRGKKNKKCEFGHMIQLQQVESKFITDYAVFDKRIPDNKLIDGVVKSHTKLFGHPPELLAADKGYYEDMDKIRELEKRIDVVSIAKKGKRNAEEIARESGKIFKLGQAFRAGIEGSISVIKRARRLVRCFRKGWQNFQSEIGRAVFVSNLLVFARISA